MIEIDFPAELLRLGLGEGPARRVIAYMETGVHDSRLEVDDAYQPDRLRESYDIMPRTNPDGGVVELSSDDAVLFNSFVLGSRPHWPFWGDPDLVEWAEERGIDPFLVAKAVSVKGTPPHPEIDNILERHESRIADMGELGVDEWLAHIF